LTSRATVERTLREAQGERPVTEARPDWQERYLNDVAWLLAQLNRRETEREALARVLEQEIHA
jgi:hypothetical protein